MAFLTKAANRGSISTGYEIDNSLKFEADNSEHLHRTPSSAGNTKTWTYSVWFKRTELGASAQLISALDTYMYFETNDQAWLNFRSGGENFFLATTRVFKDTSAWYHAVIVCDVTDSTAADRAKLYINGVRETSYANSTYQNLDSNDTTGMNAATVHRVGAYSNYGAYFNGYMAEAHLIDGQALDPTDFGEYDDSGIWKPKEYEGTYGTNGFYLDFSDGANLGDDASGNGNNFTEASITSADQATDTPTNNFCTLNPLGGYIGSAVINEGATKIDNSGTASWETAYSSIGVTSGKWYAEVTPQLGSFNTAFGIVNFDTAIHDGSTYNNAGYWLGNFDSGSSIYYYFNGSGAGSIVVNVTAGVVIGLALDLDNNTLDFYVNGSQNKQATSLPSGTYGFIADVQGTGGPYIQCNFGGYTVNTISSAATDANGYGTFEYAPPSGYYALCTKNLAEYGG
jgi:hypothetical protein